MSCRATAALAVLLAALFSLIATSVGSAQIDNSPNAPASITDSDGKDNLSSTAGTPPVASSNSVSPAWTNLLLAVQCVLIVIASLSGGWLPQMIRLTHTRMQLIMSLVGGLMLGIGLFHMLPHAVAEMGSIDRAVWWMMVGLLAMFFLLRTFHFHQHDHADIDLTVPAGHEHDHSHDHDHDHDCDGTQHHLHTHKLSWAGVTFGLAIHTLIDGMALAASVKADALHGVDGWMLGVGTFLAIVLHKPLDAVSITSLMAASGWSLKARHCVNGTFSLMCPLGAALFVLGLEQFSDVQHVIVGCALAFSAGAFFCISMGDLLPELEFHSHDRLKLSAMLLLGVALAYAIGFLEPEHAHRHHESGNSAHDDGHEE